ncbi:hypothetical protein OAN80_06000, partial [Alphaproteobacteria bacterium]|nr:hypothetical protein [Alphaproteobacteria bacterium]
MDRYGNAKDAFDEARESGLTEEEAFEKAAQAVGVTEEEQLVAEEAFNRAIAEGADPREAVYQAENAVREEFDRSDRDKQFDAQVDATSSALSVAVRSGVTAEEAINAQLSGQSPTNDDVYVVREAAYRAIDDAFENGDASSVGLLIGEGGPNASKGETTFREALISGKSIDEAFQSAFAANAGSAERDANGRIDFLGADLFAQGFDPFLQLRSKIFEATEEIIIQNDVEGDAINSFAEIFGLRTLNDVLVGDNDTNQFEAIQGSSLGGTDTIDGDGGTDELKISDIVNGLFIVTFASGGDFVVDYSTDGGNIEGKITATNVEQLFVQEVGGSQQRVETDDDGIGVIFAGTSGNDTINAFGDGTLANELAIGSKGVNTDDPKVFGSMLLGGAGNDVITSDGGNALIFGGDGNDIITVKGKTGDGQDVVQAGAGDDTVIIIEPTDFRTPDRSADQFNFDQLSGGDNENSGNGDVLQIGNSESATDQIFITDESSGGGSIVGFETLNFFRSGTIFQANEIVLINFDRIITESGVSNVTLKASFSNLNLSNATLDGGIANLTGISGVGTGLQIFDSNSDSVGRTLIGTAEDDFLSGFGGNDVFQMGGGFDQLVGGSGDDTFQIAAETDITKGIIISGGSGTDTLLLTSTSIASLEFPTTDSGGGTRPDDVNFATLEIFDVSGGSASGVSIEMRGSDLSAIPQFVGDGTSDKIKVLFDDLDLRGDTLTGIQEISFTASNTGQALNLSASTSISGLNNIAGTVNSGSVADESILLEGSRDFSGINLLDFESISLQDGNGVRQTIDVNSSTSFGLAEIRNFTTGTGSTTDVFDYKSNLVAGDGTTLSSGADLT